MCGSFNNKQLFDATKFVEVEKAAIKNPQLVNVKMCKCKNAKLPGPAVNL